MQYDFMQMQGKGSVCTCFHVKVLNVTDKFWKGNIYIH